MKQKTILLALVLQQFIASWAQQPLSTYDLNRPLGWGAQPGFEVTGGEGGEEVVVTTEEEFEAAITRKSASGERDVPLIIYVKGEIEFKKMHTWHVKNKTILGLPGSRIYSNDRTKKNSGILKFSSGSGAEAENIIMRNLTIQGAGAYDTDGDDALLFQGVKRVWVDHCTIGDGVDSSFDCNHESDYICVSWCRFIYKIPPLAGGSGGADDHRFCNTWGSSDKATESEGHLNTTFANCWWDTGCMERCPRVRFGKVHIVNCYYTNTQNHYSIGYGYKSNIYAEKCWFSEDVVPAKDYTQPSKGYADYNLQIYDCHGQNDIKQQSGDIEYFNPDNYYNYEGFDVSLVPSVVGNEKIGAGATLMVEVGKGVTGYAASSTTVTAVPCDAAPHLTTRYYTPSGRQQTSPRKGLNIVVKQSGNDGTTRKVLF